MLLIPSKSVILLKLSCLFYRFSLYFWKFSFHINIHSQMYFNSTNNYFLFNRYKSFKLKSQFKCKTVIAFIKIDKVTATDVYENLPPLAAVILLLIWLWMLFLCCCTLPCKSLMYNTYNRVFLDSCISIWVLLPPLIRLNRSLYAVFRLSSGEIPSSSSSTCV